MSRRPIFKYVLFDLPFVLALRDSLRDPSLEAWAEAAASAKSYSDLPYSRYAPAPNKPGTLVLGGGLPVFLPKELASPYIVRLEDDVVAVRFLRRVNPHRSTVMMGEVPGDRTGRASFSTVKVAFDMSSPENLSRTPQQFVHRALEAINHFLDHYRVIAERPFIGRVTVSVIQEFHLSTEFDDGSVDQMEYGDGSGPLRGFGGSLPDDLDTKLRIVVGSSAPPHIYSTLYMNVKNHLDLHEWRLALIESAVLFEAWLSDYVHRRFVKKGIPRSEADAKFVRGDGRRPRSITFVAESLVREATGFDFAATPEFSAWAVETRDKRNELVHGRRFDISKEEALGAFHSVVSAIELLGRK